MSKEYFIGIYWGIREDTINNCVNKVRNTFIFLAGIDNSFSEWYKTTRPHKGEIVEALNTKEEGIKNLLIAGQNYNDTGKLNKDLGFMCYIKSAKDYSKAHILSISCGCYNESIPNSVVLTLSKTIENEHLVKYDLLKKIYTGIVDIWNPERGTIKCEGVDLLSNF